MPPLSVVIHFDLRDPPSGRSISAAVLRPHRQTLTSHNTTGGLNPATRSGALTTGPPEEVPKAYLNYLVYDEDYQLIDQGFVKVSKAAAVGKANPKAEAETLALDVAIEQDGYLLTYLSHEAGSSATAASGSASNSRMAASNTAPASSGIPGVL